ncbi:GlcG protein [Sphingomonas sp. Root710]|uniref:GlcG/HbpS family heme-binding protein n=1 Tax=Sphingomonas sp. Root710 TaxID=1736594 RepID=UPI0006FBD45B|nr:heme-binding protein [Sphingomonas sp. Root710]KRB85365.1 GlcG protein [Sphingomonas sp. Root710]
MSYIAIAQARTIIAAAFEKGAELGLKPLSVAVLDAGGHLIAFERQDRSSTLRAQIACAKAGGALALGVSSRRIGDMAAERPAFIAALGPISPQGVVPAAGGVIVVDAEGVPIGAVGVTGDTSDNDEICGLAGIAAAGLSAQP